MIRAALAFRDNGYGTPVLIGREERIRETMTQHGPAGAEPISRCTTRGSPSATRPIRDFLYERLQRRGVLQRDCQRMVNQDRNVFAACMVASGDADAMVTGATRNYFDRLRGGEARDRRPGPASASSAYAHAARRAARSVFIADTTAHASPDRRGARRHRRCSRRRRRAAWARSRAWRCSPSPISATPCCADVDRDARGGATARPSAGRFRI